MFHCIYSKTLRLSASIVSFISLLSAMHDLTTGVERDSGSHLRGSQGLARLSSTSDCGGTRRSWKPGSKTGVTEGKMDRGLAECLLLPELTKITPTTRLNGAIGAQSEGVLPAGVNRASGG